MTKLHKVQSVQFEDGMLCVVVDGQLISQPVEDVSPSLAMASETSQNNFKISPSGYGIHWPDCDEDLSIDALMGTQHDAPMMVA